MDATALREHPTTAGAEQAVDTEKSVVVDAVDVEGDDGITLSDTLMSAILALLRNPRRLARSRATPELEVLALPQGTHRLL
jgi:hypothetical protein